MTGFGSSYATLTSAAFWMRLASDLGLVTGELDQVWPVFKCVRFFSLSLSLSLSLSPVCDSPPCSFFSPERKKTSNNRRYGLGALTFDKGYQSLWENVARDISSSSSSSSLPGGIGKLSPVTIRAGTRVVNVVRTASAGVQVSSSSSSSAPIVTTETFDRLIVTAPLQTAQSFMQLTQKESALFAQIETVRYLVTLAEPPVDLESSSAEKFFSQNMEPSRVNHAVAFAQQHRQFGASRKRSLRTFYQILDDTISTTAATEILRQDALELTGVPLGTIRAQRNWEGDSAYFP